MCHSKGWSVPPCSRLLGLLLAALFGTYLASYSRRGWSSSLVICVVPWARSFQDCTTVVWLKKTGRQRIKIQNVRIRRNMKALVHWFILAQELNQIKDRGETTWRKSRLIESRGAGKEGGTGEAAGVEVLVSGVIVTLFSSWSRLPLKSPSTILSSDAANAQRTKTNTTTKIVYIWAFSIQACVLSPSWHVSTVASLQGTAALQQAATEVIAQPPMAELRGVFSG